MISLLWSVLKRQVWSHGAGCIDVLGADHRSLGGGAKRRMVLQLQRGLLLISADSVRDDVAGGRHLQVLHCARRSLKLAHEGRLVVSGVIVRAILLELVR